MSIFDFLFSSDPPRDWPECRPVPLVFDLSGRTLNGIAARDSVDRLQELGRPANPAPLAARIACYPTLGLEIEHDGHWVDSFAFLFQPRPADARAGEQAAFRPCEIVLRRTDGESVRVTPGTTMEEVKSRFDSGGIHGDEDGCMLQVQEGDVWLYFDFDPDGRLRVLDVEPDPYPSGSDPEADEF